MNLEEAIIVLNKNSHRETDDWKIATYGIALYAQSAFEGRNFEEFEAIAIAEKYRRDQPNE